MSPPEFPRALSDREADALAFMLSPDDPALQGLREQMKRVAVVRQWDCCASIDLSVDRDTHSPGKEPVLVAVEAKTPNRGDAETFFELLLFERAGRLHTLELVHYGQHPPREFPPTSMFEAPSRHVTLADAD